MYYVEFKLSKDLESFLVINLSWLFHLNDPFFVLILDDGKVSFANVQKVASRERSFFPLHNWLDSLFFEKLINVVIRIDLLRVKRANAAII